MMGKRIAVLLLLVFNVCRVLSVGVWVSMKDGGEKKLPTYNVVIGTQVLSGGSYTYLSSTDNAEINLVCNPFYVTSHGEVAGGWKSNKNINWSGYNLRFEYRVNNSKWEIIESAYSGEYKKIDHGDRANTGSVYIDGNYNLSTLDGFKVTDLLRSDDYNNGIATVRLRVGVLSYARYHGTSDLYGEENGDHYEYLTTTTLYVCKCNAGSIVADETLTPRIAEGEYAIYNHRKENWKRETIGIKNKTDLVKLGSNQLCKLFINSFEFGSDFDSNYEYEIEKGSISYQLIDYRKFTVRRKTQFNAIECESNTLTFHVFPAVRLPNLRDNKESVIWVCSNGSGNTEISGNAIDFGENNRYKDLYDVVYSWEYSSDGRNWKKYTSNLNEEGSINLKIKDKSILETTYFRQKATLSLFGEEVFAESVGDAENYALSYVVVKPYAAINKDLFEIGVPKNKICAGEYVDGNVAVAFEPAEGEKYNYTAEGGNFDYQWKREEFAFDEYNEVAIKGDNSATEVAIDEELYFTTKYSVEVTDGCGVKVKDISAAVIHVSENPVLTQDEVSFIGCVPETDADDASAIRLESLEESRLGLLVKDVANLNVYNYFLCMSNSMTGEIQERKLGSSSVTLNVKELSQWIKVHGEGSVYLIKKDRYGTPSCVSNIIKLVFVVASDVSNNEITDYQYNEKFNAKERLIYSCGNARLGKIYATEDPVGGFSNGSYSYLWEYSYNKVNWMQMDGTDKESPIYNGGMSVEKSMYVRRSVISTYKDQKITNMGEPIFVKVYEKPSLLFSVKGEKKEANAKVLSLCYGETAYFQYEINEDFYNQLGSVNELTEDSVFVQEKGGSKKGLWNVYQRVMRKESAISMSAEFCGDTIFSNEVVVKVGENLELSNGDLSLSDCVLEGSSVEVSIKEPADYSYAFYTMEGELLTEESAVTIEIPEGVKGALPFKVKKSIGECSQTTTMTTFITEEKINRKFAGAELFVPNAVKGDDGFFYVCKNTEVNITPSVEYSNANYTWNLYEENPLTGSISAVGSRLEGTAKYLKHKFTEGDKRYKLVRTSTHNHCKDSFGDTVYVRTYSDVRSVGAISVEEPVLCYGESTKLSIDKSLITGGNGNYSYQWYYTTDKVNFSVYETDLYKDKLETSALEDTVYYGLVVTDRICNSTYSYNLAKVAVCPNLNTGWDLVSVSPRALALDANTERYSISITDNIGVATNVYFSVGGKEMKKQDRKSPFSFLDHVDYKEVKDESTMGYRVQREIVSDSKVCLSDVYYGDIVVNSGFTSDFLITTASEKVLHEGCPEKEIELYVDQLPQYNEEDIIKSAVSLQWMKRLQNSTSWAVVKGETGESITVKPDKGGENWVYACKVVYAPDAQTPKVSMLSNGIIVEGYNEIKDGLVYIQTEDNMRTNECNVCRGEQVDGLSLYCEVADGNKLSYRWEIKNGNGAWTELQEDLDVQGVKDAALIYTKKEVNELIQLRCVVTDVCGKEKVSSNVVRIKVYDKPSLVEEDVVMLNSFITPLANLSFAVPSDVKSVFYWYADAPQKSAVGNPVTFNANSEILPNADEGTVTSYYGAGVHKLHIYKRDEHGCLSDTIEYGYRLYDPIKVSGANVKDTVFCKGEKSKRTISIDEISGGTGAYEVEWYYKPISQSYYTKVDNTLDFEFAMKDENKILQVGSLKETTEFYAKVSCSNASIESVNSEVAELRVYVGMNAGSIDNAAESLCYGAYREVKSRMAATGGSGDYSYRWQMSEDGGDTWENLPFKYENYNPNDAKYGLTKNPTYIRREVTDNICKEVLYSNEKLFQVGDEIIIDRSDVNVPDGVVENTFATLRGMDQNYNYVWYDSRGNVLDTTVGREVYKTEKLTIPTSFKVSKISQYGCESSDFLEFRVETFEKLNGGDIEFERFPTVDNGIAWVCSGGKLGKVQNFSNAPSGMNLSYLWFYNNGREEYRLKGKSGVDVMTQTIDLDTCSISFINMTGKDIVYTLERVSYSEDSEGVKESASSNKLEVHIAPTLKSVDSYLIDSVAGTLKAEKLIYCAGDKGERITHSVKANVLEEWYDEKIGALPYNDLFIGFEVAEGTKSDTSAWVSKSRVNYSTTLDYNNSFAIEEMDRSYSVRFTISDGCSSFSSNIVEQRVSVIESVVDSLLIIPSGIELGDDVVVKYNNDAYKCYWYSSPEADERHLLAEDKKYVKLDNISIYDELYLQLSLTGACKSKVKKVQIPLYNPTTAGSIYSNQRVCQGEGYVGLEGEKSTGSTGVFDYQWQVSLNPSMSWMDIEGATDKDLDEELLNESAIYDRQYVRRRTTNEFGRVVYSDTLQLNHHEALKAGELSVDESIRKRAFCSVYELPVVKASSATGGVSASMGLPYKIGWLYSIDGGAYVDFCKPQYGRNDFDLSLLGALVHFDRGKNVTIDVKAVFEDSECGEVESEPMQFVLNRETKTPAIHQMKDSCESNRVTVMLDDTENYNYLWFVLDEEGERTWEQTGIFSKTLTRTNEYEVMEYGIVGTDKLTGCETGITYFNLDSLPELQQSVLANVEKQCFGNDFDVEMDAASGGSGEKHYQWQYSYDGEIFEDLAGAVDMSFHFKGIKIPTYIRRVASDMCSSIVSNAVLVDVYERQIMNLDVVADRHCPYQNFYIDVVDRNDGVQKEYEVFMIEEGADDRLVLSKEDDVRKVMVEGFKGEKKMNFYALNSETLCYSDTVGVLLKNVPEFDLSEVTITADKEEVCIGSEVNVMADSIRGADSADDSYYRYIWFASVDEGLSWKRMNVEGASFTEVFEKSTMVRLDVTNGCDTLHSDVLSVGVKEMQEMDYVSELALSIETDLIREDSAVVNVKVGSHDVENYQIVGDGEVNTLGYGSNILVYSANIYRDSSLMITKNGACVLPFKVRPLYGGSVQVDGESEVCKASSEQMPGLKATEQKGGNGDYLYQWYYRNAYMTEYVRIDGATEENYYPDSIMSETWYKRVVKDGEYSSVSNEVRIGLSNQPVLSRIYTDLDSAYYATNNLQHNDYMTERPTAKPLMLMSKVVGAESVYFLSWEKGKESQKERTKVAVNDDSIASLLVTATDVVEMEYCVLATNDCGESYTESFLVRSFDAPVFKETDVEIIAAKCKGEKANIRLNGEDGYLYVYEGYDDMSTYGNMRYSSGDTTVATSIYLNNMQEEVKMRITKYSPVTNVGTSIEVVVPFSPLKADFSYIYNGVEYNTESEPVEIAQGDKVEFVNRSENAVSYYWELMRPVNANLNPNAKGIYSYKESTGCYFYNEGDYRVTFIVKSAEGCQDTVIHDALFIRTEGFRNLIYQEDALFVGEGEQMPSPKVSVEVYPVPFDDYLIVRGNGAFVLFDSMGEKVLEGEVDGEARMEVSYLQRGTYLLKVGEVIMKIYKY